MRIIVDSKIRVHDYTPDMLNWCKAELEIDNPDFYKKERLGKWTGNTPRTIRLFERWGSDLIIPFGMLKDVWKRWGNSATWLPLFHDYRALDYSSHIEPYPYQEMAIQAGLKAKNGILVMPCGSGKTQSGLEIIARTGGRALWLTHTHDLLTQSMNRAKDVLPDAGLGTISGGKVDVGTHITFATVQTMAKLVLDEYEDFWDIIIVDECQHCCGSPTRVTQFYKVVSALSARYKIGLTATPHRADGLEKGMFALLGDVICEVTKEEVNNTTCPVYYKQIETGWNPDIRNIRNGDGTIDYNKLVYELTHDDERMEFVASEINKCDGSCMVLANRIEYLKELQKRYDKKSICLSEMGRSKKARAERKLALNKLNNGEIQCIFATYQLAKEGLDVPNLRYVIFATPESDSTTVIQSAGRVGRKAESKQYGIVIDFVDEMGMYKRWSAIRINLYKKADIEPFEIYV